MTYDELFSAIYALPPDRMGDTVTVFTGGAHYPVRRGVETDCDVSDLGLCLVLETDDSEAIELCQAKH